MNKLRIYCKEYVDLDIPDYVFKAYDENHFKDMLNEFIRSAMLSPDWWKPNNYQMEELAISYRRKKKGLDRIEAELSKGNTV